MARSFPSRSSRPGVYRRPSRVYFARRRQVLPGKANPGLLGRITETGSARAPTFYRVATLGRITETGSAQGIDVIRVVEVARIVETGSAQAPVFSVGGGVWIGPRLVVEVAFAVGAVGASQYLVVGDPSRGIVGVGKVAPSGAEADLQPVWTDITAYVLSGSITRGSSRVDSPVVQYEAGTCSLVLDNSDRRFDDTHLSGPYVSGGASLVTPMRAVRIWAQWDNVRYDLFRGFADMWDITWDGPAWSTATLTATDALKLLANVRRGAVAATGAGDDTGARVDRILDSAAWPDADRALDAGDVTLQATTLEGDALTELRLAVDSELGELYVDGAGKLVFRRRSAVTADQRSAITQATFDDGSGLPYDQLSSSGDDATLYNRVRVTREGGVEQVASDASSIATWFERTFERSDLIMETDAQALTYAQTVITRAATPERRFTELGIIPGSSPSALWPHALGRELGDRIAITRRPPGGGSPIHRDVWIRGITHEFAEGQWDTRWTLQRALDGAAPPLPLLGWHRAAGWHVLRRPPARAPRRRPVPPVRWR